MDAISMDEVTKRYGDLTALADCSVTVPEGELFALLGPNGSGKTTAIELLTGQRRPSSGTLRVLGTDPVDDPLGVRAAVGILPEREDPPSFLTPREYLEFVCSVRGVEGDTEDPIERWTATFGCEDLLETLATDLSEGQRQRVMLAAAFVHEPDLVFIDEPLVNLDPIMQERVKDAFRDYCDAGNTLFLSTHYVDVAEELCTSVAILADGAIVAECDPRDLDDGDLLAYFVDEVDDGGDGSDAGGAGDVGDDGDVGENGEAGEIGEAGEVGDAGENVDDDEGDEGDEPPTEAGS